MTPDPTVLSATDVDSRLAAELPRWTREDDAIRRTYGTHGWKATLMVVTTIGHLAEAAWHHPDLHVGYGQVEVVLSSHDVGGITERDLALARKIEEVVTWRPGDEDGPLSGTPDDPRFAYIKDD